MLECFAASEARRLQEQVKYVWRAWTEGSVDLLRAAESKGGGMV